MIETPRKRLVALGSAALVGCVIGILYPLSAGADVGTDVRVPPPGPMFREAQSQAPYDIKTPEYVPAGMTLFNVLYVEPDLGETAYSVDLWYRADDGRYFHIWQTDNQKLDESAKNPAGPEAGQAEHIGNDTWVRTDRVDRGLIIVSRRYSDSITLSLDGNIGIGELRKVAQSIK